MAVVEAVADMAAKGLRLCGILAERGLGEQTDASSLAEVNERERRQLLIGQDIVEEIKEKM